MKNFETIEDSALDTVVGGLGFNLNVGSRAGISASDAARQHRHSEPDHAWRRT